MNESSLDREFLAAYLTGIIRVFREEIAASHLLHLIKKRTITHEDKPMKEIGKEESGF